MPEPFTIRIYVPDGDPEGVRFIDRMNWTGLGIVFPRHKWSEIRHEPEFLRVGAGVYILVGLPEQAQKQEEDLPIIYIGQSDGVKNRIEEHYQNKLFWHWGIMFVSNRSDGLNRAHVTWLEYALVKLARTVDRCRLDNGNTPKEPALSRPEKADLETFLKEMIQILPLVNLRVFELPKAVATPKTSPILAPTKQPSHQPEQPDTIIVPAKKAGFEKVFLGEDCWYAIRISGGMLDKIKYIAAYQSKPVKAITHYAPVDRIEPYGDGSKYRVIFSEKAKAITPIPIGNAPRGSMQGPRYTTLAQLMAAKKLTDLKVRPCPNDANSPT